MDGYAEYWQWQFDSSPAYFQKIFDMCDVVKHRAVLDIGCGIGGRTCFLATLEPDKVLGIDINEREIELAKALALRKSGIEGTRQKICFDVVVEGGTKHAGSFDVVVLIDCLEHARDPATLLSAAHAFLRPGGICYFATMGWYHHRGAHIGDILPMPFVQLFFSDRVMLDAIRRILSAPYYVPNLWDSDPPVARWMGVSDLCDRPGESLNKITVRGIKQIVNQSPFLKKKVAVTGFSWNTYRFLRCLNVLAAVPGIQEMYHSAVFGRLEKAR